MRIYPKLGHVPSDSTAEFLWEIGSILLIVTGADFILAWLFAIL